MSLSLSLARSAARGSGVALSSSDMVLISFLWMVNCLATVNCLEFFFISSMSLSLGRLRGWLQEGYVADNVTSESLAMSFSL